MTRTTDLFTGTRRIFWGFFFLLIDFSLKFNDSFTFPLLADFVGWIFLSEGIRQLSPARPSLGLLKPFCVVLGVCSLTQFFPGVEATLPGWLALLISILTLYTYFQLPTDLAALAEETLGDGDLAKRLRASRTLLVLCQTALYCYDLLLSSTVLVFLILVVRLCVSGFLLFQLWGLSRDLE